MKKFRTILTAAALCMIFVMAAGCSISQATNIELISYPKTEFFQGEKIDNMPFTILVTLNNGNTTQISFTPKDHGAVQVANFSTTNVGSFTAYFTYRSFTYRFDYTVVGEGEYTGFAGGEGTQADPYLIANAEHFKNIVLKGNTVSEGKENGYVYYELIADIDLSGLDVATDTEYREMIALGHFKYPTESAYSFNGSLNGNGHRLMNFRATTDLGIFGTIKNGDFSNIIIDGFNTVGYRVGAFGNGPYSTDNTASASFTNVTINENSRLGFGGYIFQAKGAESVTFTNCTMSGSVYGDGNNVGGFMGDTQALNTTFTNCAMNGTVIGVGEVGAFAGWVNDVDAFHLEDEGTVERGNSVGGTVTYIYTRSSRGSTDLNVGTAVPGTYIQDSANTTKDQEGNVVVSTTDGVRSLTWDKVDGAAYYRVVFTGQYTHYITDGNSGYKIHHPGGYDTPMDFARIDSTNAATYTYGKADGEIVYSSYATTPTGIEGKTFDRNGNVEISIPGSNYWSYSRWINGASRILKGYREAALQDWYNGNEGNITESNGWLVVPAIQAGDSLLLAKATGDVEVNQTVVGADGQATEGYTLVNWDEVSSYFGGTNDAYAAYTILNQNIAIKQKTGTPVQVYVFAYNEDGIIIAGCRVGSAQKTYTADNT